jgi:fatty-acyl-CoA synthase
LERTAPIGRDPSLTLPAAIADLAARFDAAPALIGDDETLTYRGLAERAGRYAQWALDEGLAPGDVVCLLMPNRPEYAAVWLGLAQVGVVAALLNTHIADRALRHSIEIAGPKHLIVAASHAGRLTAVLAQLDPGLRCWAHGENPHGLPRIDEQIERLRASAVFRASLRDRALYIYTSGTTGLPKAAIVSHLRLMQWTHWFAGMIDTGPGDRMYNCLPMYHSVGGVVAIGATLLGGGSVAIRDRFSASRFWDDVVGSGCTLFQYIGELCRYLVASPPQPRETEHRLRLCCGNGLRADVWPEFQRRFRIPKILEFYASTEGNFSLFNPEGMPGAIGRIPAFLAHRLPVALIRVDVETGEPLRGADSFCLRCEPDETGEAIAKIAADGSASGSPFQAYTDREASERKILRNVLAGGDAWFRSGDLMRRDRRGYFYFIDRTGDTFRWKGENVSTTEVEAAVAAAPGVVEAVVYGVAVPGMEGRVGMAAIVPGRNWDPGKFRDHLAERLPDYARPAILRLRGEIERTGTFKPQKQHLAREGFDPAMIGDELYIDDRAAGAFVRLDAARYRRLADGLLKL